MSKKTNVKLENVEHQENQVTRYAEIFDIVKANGNYFIGVGNKIVSKNTFATLEEAQNYIDSKPWELIINASCLCMDMSKTTK